jgi:HEPN domain-containing protein
MNFDIVKTVDYWRAGARYDLATAKALFDKSRYPYALFFGHLALEKLLKALVVAHTKKHAPHTHSLPQLAAMLPFEPPEEILTPLKTFMEYYFEARYPEGQKAFYEKRTKVYARDGLRRIKEVFRWLGRKF